MSKMRPAEEGGSRIGIVLNGSPLFTGGAGSGESEIRRYVLENDLVEAIIALPTDMFYNTGIATYVWMLSNRKPATARARCSSSTRRLRDPRSTGTSTCSSHPVLWRRSTLT
jgi:type I restriction enzyme M protein